MRLGNRERLGRHAESSLMVAPTHAETEELFPDYREAFKGKLVTLKLITSRRKIPFRDKLSRHGEDSEAWYFCDKWIVGDDVIMGQFMKPLAKSSEHQHQAGIHESYYPLTQGDFFVRMERGDRHTYHRVITGEELEIPIDTYHGAFTMQDPVLVLIVMRGAARIPENQWHNKRRRFLWHEEPRSGMLRR